MLACQAAACAEGSVVGIGGRFISSQCVSWFAETSEFAEVQEQWPCLTKEAQRYIACFETLAGLPTDKHAIAAGTDNAAEAACGASPCPCPPAPVGVVALLTLLATTVQRAPGVVHSGVKAARSSVQAGAQVTTNTLVRDLNGGGLSL